ncbi:hypothetical protein NPIL_439961 [Nephila pilipes]|uniref:Uncharacterized protein n=1 Tax=Nephila pilipes TaxID=299642 RepID=A0A8X6NFL1_NEPPI|nr:hypothetical protein NPIL_439961 [Nephila pilipes]
MAAKGPACCSVVPHKACLRCLPLRSSGHVLREPGLPKRKRELSSLTVCSGCRCQGLLRWPVAGIVMYGGVCACWKRCFACSSERFAATLLCQRTRQRAGTVTFACFAAFTRVARSQVLLRCHVRVMRLT